MEVKAKIVRMVEHRGVSKATGAEWRSKDVDLQLYDDQCKLTDTLINVRMYGKSLLYDAPVVCEGATGLAGIWVSRDNGYITATFSGWKPQNFVEGKSWPNGLSEINKAWLKVLIAKRPYDIAREELKAIEDKERAEQIALLNQSPAPVQAAPAQAATAAPANNTNGLPF